MKKLFTALALTLLFTSCALAQSINPRFGIVKGDDNTGRVLTYAINTTTDVTSATIDTIALNPNAWQTIVRPSAALADSVVYKVSVSRAFLGDELCFQIRKGTGAGAVKFFNTTLNAGANFITSTATANVALAANKVMLVTFRFNGTKWIEQSRVVQP